MTEITFAKLKPVINGSKLHSILAGAGYTTHHQDGPIDWMEAPRRQEAEDDENRREKPLLMSVGSSE